MSVDGTKLLFEGFLQKRKDTVILRWVTYWFRLHNTTLFFYTKKSGSASHLRGNYYIYTVQSVREIHEENCKRFMFEIIMNNGKRKLLAAKTADLRQEWVGHLWQAMHLSTSPMSHSRGAHHEVHQHQESAQCRAPISSHSDGVVKSPLARPLSASTGHIHCEIRGSDSPTYQSGELNTEEATYLNHQPASNYQRHNGGTVESCGMSSEVGEDGDYDVLPIRKKICNIEHSPETEVVYDYPLSNRRAAENQDATESIYDVPSCLLKMMSDRSLDSSSEGHLEEEAEWRI